MRNAIKPKSPTTVLVDVLPPCEICAVEFTCSKPNGARWEGPVGGGVWASACEAHGDNLRHKAVEYVVDGGTVEALEE